MRRILVPDRDQPPAAFGAQLLQKSDRGYRRSSRPRSWRPPLRSPGARPSSRSLSRPARTARVDQRRLTSQRPLGPQGDIGPNAIFVHEEDLGPCGLRFGTQGPIGSGERFSLRHISLRQPLPGSLDHRVKPMQVVQATSPTEQASKAFLDEGAHGFRVGQPDTQRLWRCLDCRHQRLLLSYVENGGPPVCSKASPAGPRSRAFSFKSPVVWASRPNASAIRTAVQPRASNQRTCRRSRSRGVAARYTCFAPSSHPTAIAPVPPACHLSQSLALAVCRRDFFRDRNTTIYSG